MTTAMMAPSCLPTAPQTGALFVEDAFFVAYRYGHHAARSGYDRFADYLGERVTVSPRLARQGETLLRLPAKLIEAYSGVYEYRRPDVIQELAVLQHMRRRQGGIYHFLYAEKSLYLAARANRWRGHRVVGSFHHAPGSYSKRFRSTKFLRNIEHAVVVSRAQIDFMESLVGPGKASFVPYAVDADYFRPPGERHPARRLRCTCLGEHMRDFDSLPGIIRGITDSCAEAEFYVVGGRPDAESLVREIPRTFWKTRVSDAEYLDILQQTDVLVLPLKGSTSVTSVNEALACGVPVVTNAGGVEDYLTEACGVVCAVGDVAGMVDAAVEILRNEQLRERMSKAARQQGLSLDWTKSAARMADLYRRLRA